MPNQLDDSVENKLIRVVCGGTVPDQGLGVECVAVPVVVDIRHHLSPNPTRRAELRPLGAEVIRVGEDVVGRLLRRVKAILTAKIVAGHARRIGIVVEAGMICIRRIGIVVETGMIRRIGVVDETGMIHIRRSGVVAATVMIHLRRNDTLIVAGQRDEAIPLRRLDATVPGIKTPFIVLLVFK